MQIAQNFATKLYVAFVVIAMMLMAVAPAQAKTAEELQAEITALMATINELQSQVGQGGTSVASGICPYSWTRSLSSGSTGDDVKKLQMFLNASEDTRVAMAGAGSVGSETMYYGPATAAAVSKFQVKYRADILSPGGLVNPTGYFGAATIAKAKSLWSGASTGGDDSTDDTDGDDADEDDSDSADLQGEGSLEDFTIDDADDTDIQEGEEDAAIAELTIKAEDGDIEVDRLDLTITGVNSPTEADAADVFDTITLWVDGESIAEFDASDEDEYLDEDDGTFRFTNLGLVVREDEEVEVTVAASVTGNVDDAGTDASWKVSVDEMRFFDADDVADDDSSTGDLGDFVNFDIVTQGDGEELKFSLGSGNPDATDIVVDTDDKTDGATVLEYTIEAKDAAVDLNTLFVKLTTSTSSNLVIDDVTLDIDGETFDAENSPSTSTTFTAEFDIDGDVTIDEDEEVTVKVMVDLRAQEVSNNVPRYSNGTTIKAEVTSVERDLTDAEGADDIDEFSGAAVGDTHTLVAEGIVVPADGFSSEIDTLGTNDTIGEFTVEFEVTAVEGDFYITEFAGTSATSNGVQFTVDGTVGTGTVSASLTSTGDEDTSGVFTVSEGETETFTLTVTVDPAATGTFRVELNEVWYSANTNGITSSSLYTPTPVSDFRTGSQAIQG